MFYTCHEDRTSTPNRQPIKHMKHSSCPPSIFVWHHQPLLTSEGSAMPLLSLDSAVERRVICGSPWNRKGVVYHVEVCSLQIRSKHHQRASTGMSTFSKLGLSHEMYYLYIFNIQNARPVLVSNSKANMHDLWLSYILHQKFHMLYVTLCSCMSRLYSCYRTRDQSPYTYTNFSN